MALPALPYSLKFSYATVRFGTTLLMSQVDLILFWIYTNSFNLDPRLTGIGSGFGKFVLAFSYAYFGYLSDRLPLKFPFGNRKFFMWTGTPLIVLSFIMLFTPHLFVELVSGQTLFIWLLGWSGTFNLFFGYIVSPYQALMPEITSFGDRPTVSAFQTAGNFLASTVGFGFSFLMLGLLTSQGFQGQNVVLYTIPIFVFGALFLLSITPSLVGIRNPARVAAGNRIVVELRAIMQNKNYIRWLIVHSLTGLGLAVVTALLFDFMSKILLIDTIYETLTVGAVLFVSTLLGIAISTEVIRRKGNKFTLLVTLGWIAIGLVLTLVPSLRQAYVIGMILGSGSGSVNQFQYIIIADLVEEDVKRSGTNRSGSLTGFKSIPYNTSQAIGFFLAGYLVDNLELFGLIPIIFIILSIPVTLIANFDPMRSS